MTIYNTDPEMGKLVWWLTEQQAILHGEPSNTESSMITQGMPSRYVSPSNQSAEAVLTCPLHQLYMTGHGIELAHYQFLTFMTYP
jgi:hypothetical protein